MKNIHVLPTDKPSRLFKFEDKLIKNDLIGLYDFNDFKEKGYTPQCIYITSDEEIKEGDLFFNGENVLQASRITDIIIDTKGLWSKIKTSSRVVLTTDQELIKAGVQAIDDTFLEWFVKNPSCEFVPIITTIVLNESTYRTNIGFESWRKEELKQETNLDKHLASLPEYSGFRRSALLVNKKHLRKLQKDIKV